MILGRRNQIKMGLKIGLPGNSSGYARILVAQGPMDLATGGGPLATGGARCMLNHLWCAVGPLHSQKNFNFGVNWGA